MNWLAWTLVAFLALGPILHITMIGKPRDPYTPGSAVFSIIIAGLMIWGVIALANGGAS